MTVAFVGLGSNLADPEAQVRSALIELDTLQHSRCLGHSSLYRSAPLLLADASPDAPENPFPQPDYINAVVALDTGLNAQQLLAALQDLEHQHQRVRAERWGPRTLDLDLLLFGDERIDTPELTVPHPGLYERNFVLYPLAELVTKLSFEVQIPGGRSLNDLLAECAAGGLEKLV